MLAYLYTGCPDMFQKCLFYLLSDASGPAVSIQTMKFINTGPGQYRGGRSLRISWCCWQETLANLASNLLVIV